ncbi:MAG: DNA translocase FtsK [Bacillota bacterium]
MARVYRVKRSGDKAPGTETKAGAQSGSGRNDRNSPNGGNGRGEETSRRPRSGRGRRTVKQGRRWPWALLLLAGMALIIAMGISGYNPEGGSPVTIVFARLARFVSSIAGALAMFFCFILILNSVVKLVNPGDPLPRFVWGFWVLLVFGSSIYHAVRVPWEDVFTGARMGGGGGLIGASVWWFFRIATGRYVSLPVMFLGIAVAVSLLANKSPWTPFSLIWMAFMSGWQWFKEFVGRFFGEHGPDPEEIWHDEPGDEAEEDEELSLRDLIEAGSPGRGAFSSTVAEIQARLGRGQDGQDETGAEPAGDPGLQSPVAGAPGGRDPGGADAPASGRRSKAGGVEEFEPSMEQQPLSEDVFYEIPPLDILQKSEPSKRPKPSQSYEALGRVIERTLLSFGIAAKVIGIERGPAVTRFELQPGPGVKVASIVNLSQDLALALASQDVRIEAPIPGKSAIGIEVPNKEVSLVHLRDVLETREFRNSKSPLTIALGKDISGRSVVTTLDHCLHLLIAGATGAGKSVCINSIIASLLFKARPDQVKLVLIDPKRVELSVWSKVPHLIAPVVSDPKKAAGALRWAIKEMESRYEKFTKVGTRDIDRYNQVATPPDSLKPAMPYIVIIIDELSDLMMVAPAEVEDAIFRLAQMARASGIYLVVATQRPSVDVITGTIKANIPSRIAFAVASQIDSRTILDMAGAEKLLGRGDMLFHPVGSSKPLRNQGCYISEREIDELVSFVSAQAKPQFATGILQVPETLEQESEISDDPFFPQALRIVVEAKQASVSLLQRKLPIGYSRAARLIDAMEVKGYVGPYEGSKPREVRITMAEYLRMFEAGTQAAATAASPGSSSHPSGSSIPDPNILSGREHTAQAETAVEKPSDPPFVKRPTFVDELRSRGSARALTQDTMGREGRETDPRTSGRQGDGGARRRNA